MIRYNMFDERVEKFNEENERKRVADLLNEEKQMKVLQESYSVAEVQELFHITEDEARKLVKSGLFKTYCVGNVYRASKKSVEETQKTVNANGLCRNERLCIYALGLQGKRVHFYLSL